MKTASPCFSNQGIRILLQILHLSAALEYSALEGTCPLTKAVPAGEHHKWTRDSFLIPASFPSLPHVLSDDPSDCGVRSTVLARCRCGPVEAEASGEARDGPSCEQHQPGASGEWLLT